MADINGPNGIGRHVKHNRHDMMHQLFWEEERVLLGTSSIDDATRKTMICFRVSRALVARYYLRVSSVRPIYRFEGWHHEGRSCGFFVDLRLSLHRLFKHE